MSEEGENDFEAGASGAADCVPTQVGSIKKGGYCMLKGHPCKVIEYSTAKPGKHGSAKATIVGVDLFTNKKYEDGGPTASNIDVPIVSKSELEIADVLEKECDFMLDDGSLRQGFKLPLDDPELVQTLRDLFAASATDNTTVMATVIKARGQEKIVEVRKK